MKATLNSHAPAAASDLLAAAGNALTPGHTTDPTSAAGFLALIQQALGLPGTCPTPVVAPEGTEGGVSTSSTIGALPDVSTNVSTSSTTEALPDVSTNVPTSSTTEALPDVSTNVSTSSTTGQVPTVEPVETPLATARPTVELVETPLTTAPHGSALGRLAGPADPHATEPGERGRKLGHSSSDTAPLVSTGSTTGKPAGAAGGVSTSSTTGQVPTVEPVETPLATARPTVELVETPLTTAPHGRALGRLAGPADPHAAGPGERGRRLGHSSSDTAPLVSTSSTIGELPDVSTSVPTSSTTGEHVETEGAVPTSSTTGTRESTPLPAQTITPAGTAVTSTVAASTPTAPTPAANPVTTQVVDRIQALTSTNGTHRITLDLTPGDLGQVRVVMTVRDGAVHVRLAASERDTRATLTEGAADLRTLLTAAGATDPRITVRELGNTSNTQFQFEGQTPQQQHRDQHAGTRAQHHPATDGTTTPQQQDAAGATGTRSSETVASNRDPSGLDVTM